MPKHRNFGNIRALRSGRFQARYTAPDGAIVNGPTTFGTRRSADDWLAQQQAMLSQGTWSNPALSATTLGEYACQWLESRADLRPTTRQLYADHIRRFITGPFPDVAVLVRNPQIGFLPLKQLNSRLIQSWLDWVAALSRASAARRGTGSTRGGGPRAVRLWAEATGRKCAATGRLPSALVKEWEDAGRPNTLPSQPQPNGSTQTAQVYRTLRAICNSAEAEGRMNKNPCTVKGAGQTRPPRRPTATAHEVALIASHMPERYRSAITLAAFGGLRAGEVFGLARQDVDLDAGSVTIRQALQGKALGPPKTAAGYRTIHLPRGTVDQLAAHLDRFVDRAPDSLVFTTSTRAPLSSSQRTAMFRRAAERAGRPDMHFHDLRHTGATLALETGASIAQVMRRIGHSTPRATMIYLHAGDEGDRHIAQRLAPSTALPRNDGETLAPADWSHA